jgi:pyroglutamyl-peptidase
MAKPTLTKPHKTPGKKSVRTVRCVISGFDAFGSFTFNPSQKIVELLPTTYEIPRTNIVLKIEKLVLPTCCSESWKLIKRQLGKQHCDVLIMTGLANTRQDLSLERFALNIRDYGMKDNSGHEWNDSQIHKGEVEALKTDLPLVPLRTALRKNNHGVYISNHAGTFICNEVYYQALREKQRSKNLGSVLFLHVPDHKDYVKTMLRLKPEKMENVTSAAKRKSIALQWMADAVLEIASYCAVQSAKR